MSSKHPARLLIKNGTLIDGLGGPPVKNPGIYIEGDTIKNLGAPKSADDAERWRSATTIDAENQYVMPGLIDGHCHLSLHQGALPGVTFTSSAEFCAFWAARTAAQTLHAGVTSISVPGGKWFADVRVRDGINGGLLEGPRVFSAGRALTSYGGIFDDDPAYFEDSEHSSDSSGIVCNTVDEYLTEVRRQCKQGVDLIKIADSLWGDVQTIRQEEIAAVVGEAHRRNVRVTIHARGSGATRAAALAGVDWIMHADLASDEDLDVVAKAGTPIMPTFTAVYIGVEHGADLGFSVATRDRMKRQLDLNYRAIQEARKRGIPILAGSDTGNMSAWGHGKFHGREPEILVKQIGLSPIEAITSMTHLNAQVVGLSCRVGAIATEKLADIIIWDADPVADISILRRTEHLTVVIKGGAIVDRSRQGFRELPEEPPRARSRSG
jgi:imidazolonepropionase-like amidohydrolase